MNIGLIYSVVAAVGIFQLLLILNRTLKTNYKENIDTDFVKLLCFFVLFGISDFFWGICDSNILPLNNVYYNVITYFYHVLCGLSAFMWFGYILKYMKLTGSLKTVCNVYRIILFACQSSMIIVNIFTKDAFYFDADLVYHTGRMRTFLYSAQFLYYVFILILVSINIQFTEDEGEQKILGHVFLFTLVPLIFGILQYLFYNVAMYSMGFMLSAFIIYAFNLTEIREKALAKVAEESTRASFIDALTGLLNRRAYEETISLYKTVSPEPDFVYVSMDLNELKRNNDEVGHEAGDELIKGSAQIMLDCFSPYGRVYRIGGDEFVALLNVKDTPLEELQAKFDNAVSSWKGELVPSLRISSGYVAMTENPEFTISQVVKTADARMYKAKAEFYSSKGVDRRGQAEAFSVLCTLYTKILKLNLNSETYQVIKVSENEKSADKGFSDNIFTWLHDFGTTGQVHKDDLENYLEKVSPEYLRAFFKDGKNSLSIPYRRNIDGVYHDTIMEMVPAPDYIEENQSVYLYVKALD